MINILDQPFKKVPFPEFIDTEEKVNEVLNYISKIKHPIAVDTETTGLNKQKDIALIFSISDGRKRFTILGKFVPLFEEFFNSHSLIFHNINFDRAILRNSGITWNLSYCPGKDFDTIFMHHFLDQESQHSLAWISKNLLNLHKFEFKELFGKNGFINLDRLSLDETYKNAVNEYASFDAYVTFLCFELFLKELDKLNMLKLFNKFKPFMDVLYLMETEGIKVNINLLQQWKIKFEFELNELRKKFKELLGQYNIDEEINIQSSKQISDLFFNKLRKDPIKFSEKTNFPSVDEEVLEILAEEDSLAKLVLKYRNLHKQYSTYIVNLIETADSKNRIHTNFNFTRTYRLSSSDPNLQNIPKDEIILNETTNESISFRKIFIADENNILLDADYDQAELVIVSNLAKDELFLNAIKQGKDLHSLTASRLYNIPYEEYIEAKNSDNPNKFQKELLLQRYNAKQINFQILYGIGPDALAKNINSTKDEAAELINKFFNDHPRIKDFFEIQKRQLFRYGCIQTISGRMRKFSGIYSSDKGMQSFLLRAATNTPIQGSVADIISLAMIKLAQDKFLVENGVKLVLQIHDELIFEMPEENKDEKIFKHIEDILSSIYADKLECQLKSSVSYGKNWHEAKK
jgi:DNA polymerase-1